MGKEVRSRKDRKAKNYLLQPLLQIKLGIYSVTLAFAFAIAILIVVYSNFYQFSQIVIALTDSEEEIRSLFTEEVLNSSFWVLILVICFLTLNVFVSIIYTHRLVGPTVAFRRCIQNLLIGEYDSRVVLRRNDAFKELANDINLLANHVEKLHASLEDHKNQSDQVNSQDQKAIS